MPILLLLWGGAQKAFGAVLEFCSKPPGSWIAAAVALALGLWWFGQHEFNRGEVKCEAAHAEAAANEINRQIVAEIAANKRSEARTAVSEQKNTDNQKVIVYVKEKSAAMAGASDECVPVDIADKLRDLQ